jgi:hypothetical protein
MLGNDDTIHVDKGLKITIEYDSRTWDVHINTHKWF